MGILDCANASDQARWSFKKVAGTHVRFFDAVTGSLQGGGTNGPVYNLIALWGEVVLDRNGVLCYTILNIKLV